jgi:hypothetical protein
MLVTVPAGREHSKARPLSAAAFQDVVYANAAAILDEARRLTRYNRTGRVSEAKSARQFA